ncbi:MAG: CFI-box-CTERM domain-containing protein [Ruminococcus sp.]|nr:CFI-box-CTERM domain-containing protein [Ruminococcus sp.]
MEKTQVMGKAIEEITTRFGDSVYYDVNKFCALFDDIAPSLVSERKILHRVFDSKALCMFLELKNANSSEHQIMISKIETTLLDEYGLSEKWTSVIISGFCWAYSIEYTAPEFNEEEATNNYQNDTDNKSNSFDDFAIAARNNSNGERKEIAISGGLYIGEAVANKPHGNGKAIYENGDSYVGEWKFGKKDGNGLYKYKSGDEWKGEWKEDQPYNGDGVVYSIFKKIVNQSGKYIGSVRNGSKEGNGEFQYNNGDSYAGSWSGNKRNGNGIYKYKNGKELKGVWKDNKIWDGSGYLAANVKIDNNGMITSKNAFEFYEGDFKQGVYCGKGKLNYDKGGSFEGEFKNGRPWLGNGRLVTSTFIYDGDVKEGKRDGFGKTKNNNGKIWEAEYVNDEVEGNCKITYADGSLFEGEYRNGVWVQGKGVVFYDDNSKYEGEIRNGKRNGNGVLFYSDGSRYTGSWLDDKREGKGCFYWGNRVLTKAVKTWDRYVVWKNGGKWDGEFKNDEPWKGYGVWYYTNYRFVGSYEDGLEEGYGEIWWREEREYDWKGTFHKGQPWEGDGHWYNYDSGEDSCCIYSYRLKNGKRKDGSGCYIATCVYGSYDCPQVWILRRYRDSFLSKRILGRAFIRVYYFISPILVKAFGKKNWFNEFWAVILNKRIIELKEKGYSDLPYSDTTKD